MVLGSSLTYDPVTRSIASLSPSLPSASCSPNLPHRSADRVPVYGHVVRTGAANWRKNGGYIGLIRYLRPISGVLSLSSRKGKKNSPRANEYSETVLFM
jgi:hypothetical protein